MPYQGGDDGRFLLAGTAENLMRRSGSGRLVHAIRIPDERPSYSLGSTSSMRVPANAAG